MAANTCALLPTLSESKCLNFIYLLSFIGMTRQSFRFSQSPGVRFIDLSYSQGFFFFASSCIDSKLSTNQGDDNNDSMRWLGAKKKTKKNTL